MAQFAQQTRLVATRGKADDLAAKFTEAADLQRDNDACQLMLVAQSVNEEDVVYITEVWSDESAWQQARKSQAVADWAKDISPLVTQWPASFRLKLIGGKGIR